MPKEADFEVRVCYIVLFTLLALHDPVRTEYRPSSSCTGKYKRGLLWEINLMGKSVLTLC